ncbi:MAG: phosphatidylserine decarboxylase [Acidobacteria bacterium]|nr:phosphatidylserine decarboxylase [Acidobacteriota bacterium]
MVLDGIYYALALVAGGALVSCLTHPVLGIPLYLLAAFCLYFFRDPDRAVPPGPVAVSPADGKVVAIVAESPVLTRISIFLNVFDVHVNRSPVSGTITDVKYSRGKFLVASKESASVENEQNTITVDHDGAPVVFKQIAGLIARRIVCYKKPGDHVDTGERIGLIKFGSRMDVVFGPGWQITVKPGDRVAAGSSIIARRISRQPDPS